MEEGENKQVKYWQEKDGKPSFMRIAAAFCVYSGVGILWFQVVFAAFSSSMEFSEIEWAGPISLVTVGLTGKVAQKFGEK